MPRKSIRQPIVPIGPSIAYIPLTKGQFALISRDQLYLVDMYHWIATKHGNQVGEFQARGLVNGKTRSLHSFLLGLDGRNVTADHVIPGNPLNCLPHNLRTANRTQQVVNRRRFSSTNHLKGMYQRNGKWRACIKIAGKNCNLGTFSTQEAAHQVYCEAARAAFGEFFSAS